MIVALAKTIAHRYTGTLVDIYHMHSVHARGNEMLTRTYLVEVIELNASNGTTDTRGDGLAGVADKVRHRKELGSLLLAVTVDLKMPVVAELKLETSVIRRLNGDDVRAEVRSQQQAQ